MTASFEGDGTAVHCATVFETELWDEFCDAVLMAPRRPIANEELGGKTSDVFMTTHDAVSPRGKEVSTDPARIEGFLAAFPGGHFGSMLWWVVASHLDIRAHPGLEEMRKRYNAWARGPDGPGP